MSEDDPRHGTIAGRRVHRESGVPLCEPCRAAHNAYNNARRNRYKESRECLGCGRKTTNVTTECRSCRHKRIGITFTDDDVLTGGDWVPRGGIMRWEAWA